MSNDHDQLLTAIASSFIASADHAGFNGAVASTFMRVEKKPEQLRKSLADLVVAGKITAVFRCASVNMHIKRFPDLPIEKQLELLQSEELNAFCLYPTETTVLQFVDVAEWYDRPFSKALLLAEPQLAFRAFEMGALERYVADPRYAVHFYDYMGSMSVVDEFFKNEQHPERD